VPALKDNHQSGHMSGWISWQAEGCKTFCKSFVLSSQHTRVPDPPALLSSTAPNPQAPSGKG
jgi:hypothetical protein